jgi:hypothetical protein
VLEAGRQNAGALAAAVECRVARQALRESGALVLAHFPQGDDAAPIR